MIDVSIVSGTYNRLPYMKRMVESVRYSVYPLNYEIFLVDGGSTDGTLDWCKTQEDIRLIKQGKLLGAVKAFNAGARAAEGRYVILANDDIEFVGRSILRSWAFMEDFRDVGIGCFFQDRNNKHWHVEQMPAIALGGRQISTFYGQVCIVPRWLGDKVGWWGDYLHTYGGDNELSCNVIELGYEVLPVYGSKIHDFSNDLKDELRRINNDDPRSVSSRGGTHPDSDKWSKKWSHLGKVGPRLLPTPVVQNMLKPRDLRILYAPIYEPGNKLQKQTKRGLRDSLSRIGTVAESDFMTDGLDSLQDMACAICPDVFVLQLQDASVFKPSVIQKMRANHPEAIFVSWNGDYHPKNLYDPTYMELMKEMDHAGFAVASIKDNYKAARINWFYWQIGYEKSDEEITRAAKRHDVVFLGNAYTELRKDLGRFLIGLQRDTGLDIGLYGSWPNDWSQGSNLYDFSTGEGIYRNAKLAISDQQWPDATGYVSNRLFQAMAAGRCMVLQQEFKGMSKYLGVTAGIHLDTWKTHRDLEEKINYYLENEDARQAIANRGHDYVMLHHSFNMRVKELLDVLNV